MLKPAPAAAHFDGSMTSALIVDRCGLMRPMTVIDRPIEKKTCLLLDVPQVDRDRGEAPECEAPAPGAERPDEASGPRKLIKKRIV
ncbi:MAG: hypothetical protein ACRD3T_21890 [Terriglobia bacterium]